MLHFKKDWELNPDLPVLGPWRTVRPINNPIWLLERNPYYYAVDTAGNQLPYFDHIQFTLAENLEVVNLRAMAGEYDEQERHIDLGKLPVLLENQDKGNYKVHLDLGFAGSDFMFHVNQSYMGDAEIRKWLTNADFRRALSLGIDRDQLNETFWLGVGTPGSPAPGETMPQSPGPDWRKKWSVLDVAHANALLDKIGLAKKDSDGFRVRTDNGERLRLQVIAIAAFLPYPKLSEMVADQWRKIGIQADVKEMERGLGFAKETNNEHQLFVWNNGGTELLYLFPTWAVPVIPGAAFGPAYATWFSSGGKQGTKPDDPNILKIFELYSEAAGLKADGRNRNAQEIWKILVDQQYGIGTVGQSPAGLGVRLVSNKLGNIASRVCNAQHCRTPGNSHPETWYFKA
jgi:peptide/nickel transport system substrate-binding protein